MLLAFLCVVGSCGLNPFRLPGDDTGTRDAGAIDADPNRPDADPNMADASPFDAAPCIPTGTEVCGDNTDNDCDGSTDEGFDLDNDPANCGMCGNSCVLPHAAGTCTAGECGYECLPGYHDLNGDLGSGGNGCEYGPCFARNGGVELCNFADEDCDGFNDEGIDTDTDVQNCGTCANICQALNAEPLCVGGSCTFGDCDPGYADVLPGVPGCEYRCPENPPAADESCDNIDNDCDGVVDELPIVGLGGPCTDPGFEMIGDTGECAFGITECQFGTPTCVGYQGPTGEVCDMLDNDCDGVADNGFDLQNDPRYCGDCTPCNLADAVPGCSGGVCTILACRPGFTDADGMAGNGCEYACNNTGPEICDGVDNDCDTLTDEALTPPGNFCAQAGPCAGTMPTCSDCGGVTQWRCVYGGAAEVDACGALVPQETLCDEIDGDCDAVIDEAFALKDTPCDDGGIGICRGTGAYICDIGDPTQVTCDITNPGQMPGTELCNNEDDDCNGVVDDGAVDDMEMVSGGMLPDFWIDTYEASRPDATMMTVGSAEHRACSVPDVLPWRNVSWAEAEAACLAAGKRLCTEAEWQLSCEGLAGNLYPYGNTYDPLACNGRDYDLDCTPPDDNDIALPTATPYGCPAPMTSMCVSPFGVYDLSGNVKEWTGTEAPMGSGSYRVRGGAYDNIEPGLTCDFDFISFDTTVIFPNLGFRCCSDTAP